MEEIVPVNWLPVHVGEIYAQTRSWFYENGKVCLRPLFISFRAFNFALSMNKLLLIYVSLALCRFHLSLLERINNHSLVFSLLTWMVQGNLFRLPLCIIACSLLILRFFKPFFSPSILWVYLFKEISGIENRWLLVLGRHFLPNFVILSLPRSVCLM